MTRSITFAAGAALALALAACDRPSEVATGNATAENIDMGNNLVGNETAAVVAMTAADFASTIAASDMFEIESGKLAAEKGTSAEIKDFGTMLQADHKKSTGDLKAAGGKAEPAITPAPTLTGEQQANLDKLKAASGAEFDRMFAEQQVAAHQKALDVLRAYSAGGDTQPLREFATKAATVVEGHLEKARGLAT